MCLGFSGGRSCRNESVLEIFGVLVLVGFIIRRVCLEFFVKFELGFFKIGNNGYRF